MLRKITLAVVVSATTLSTAIANPTSTHIDGDIPVETSPLNCDALTNDNRVCVVNKTHSAIKSIRCDGRLFGTVTISVPGGRIPSGGIAIVDFNKGNCSSAIYITTGDGKLHQIPGQNVDQTTQLIIESDEW